MKAAVVVFPGSNCDEDCFHALKTIAGADVRYFWHKDKDLPKVDLIVLPGGFSYGDYLRTGAIARFAPAMESVQEHAKQGRPVLGICNGFQILLEAGLLPGAMLRNKSLSFVCKHVYLRVDSPDSPFTNRYRKGDVISLPVAHGEGNYFTDQDTLKKLQDEDRIVFRYASKEGKLGEDFNPNGSLDNIAGILNEKRNVLGMMPHPERASEPALGCEDGKRIWESILNSMGAHK